MLQSLGDGKWFITYLRVPGAFAVGTLELTDNPLLLLMMNALLSLSAMMNVTPLTLILTPVLLPVVTADPVNMSPVHSGIVLLMNLGFYKENRLNVQAVLNGPNRPVRRGMLAFGGVVVGSYLGVTVTAVTSCEAR